MPGPLEGIKIVELAGIGPGPYACMLLADAGADVVRIDKWAPILSGRGSRTGEETHWDVLSRSRPSVAVDLKKPDGVALVLELVEKADALVEGWRPGVAERLGLGPDDCWERNPRLVYGRMTGWGQDGPLAERAGHDIDYIAIAGALYTFGRAGERPVPPMNLVGDFGGGGMLMAFGICAALLEARQSKKGQVVDAAMVDGVASLMSMTYGLLRIGWWSEQRGANVLDTGAPFYEVYECADGGWFAVGALEPQFYSVLIEKLGLAKEDLPAQHDRSRWAEMKARFAAIFKTKTRAEWEELFSDADACAAPVLSPLEAPQHPHNRARSTFVEVDGIVQPAPAPRFSRTPSAISRPPSLPGADTEAALGAWGIAQERIEQLRSSGVVG